MIRFIFPASAILAALLLLSSCGSSNSLTRDERRDLISAYEENETFTFRNKTIYGSDDVDVKVSGSSSITFNNVVSAEEMERGLPWGDVKLGMIMDSTGTPKYILPLEVTGYRTGKLTENVIKMVERSTYSPAFRDDKAVHSIYTTTFSIPKSGFRF